MKISVETCKKSCVTFGNLKVGEAFKIITEDSKLNFYIKVSDFNEFNNALMFEKADNSITVVTVPRLEPVAPVESEIIFHNPS